MAYGLGDFADRRVARRRCHTPLRAEGSVGWTSKNARVIRSLDEREGVEWARATEPGRGRNARAP
jgi:hypothetical protein